MSRAKVVRMVKAVVVKRSRWSRLGSRQMLKVVKVRWSRSDAQGGQCEMVKWSRSEAQDGQMVKMVKVGWSKPR